MDDITSVAQEIRADAERIIVLSLGIMLGSVDLIGTAKHDEGVKRFEDAQASLQRGLHSMNSAIIAEIKEGL